MPHFPENVSFHGWSEVITDSNKINSEINMTTYNKHETEHITDLMRVHGKEFLKSFFGSC